MANNVHSLCRCRLVGSSTTKAVLLLMADSASESGEGIWLSKANIARDLELSKRTVQLAIKSLVEMGLCSEVGMRPCARGYTHEYALDLRAIRSLPSTREGGESDGNGAQEKPARGERGSPVGVKEIHARGEGDSPNPSFTHPLEPSLFGSNEPLSARAEKNPDRFDKFWSAYPVKGSKVMTKRAYSALIKSGEVTHDDLMLRLAEYLKSDPVKRGFTKNSTNFFGTEVWRNFTPKPASGLSQIDMLLQQAMIEDRLNNPAEARRLKAEARKLGWQG